LGIGWGNKIWEKDKYGTFLPKMDKYGTFFSAPSKSIKIKMSTPAFKAEAYKLFNTLIEQWESSLSPGVPTGTQLNSPQMAEAGNEEGVSYMEEGVSLRGLGL